MNIANKITISRIFMSIIILVLLLFPWHQAGVEWPIYEINGNIIVELKYLIAGGLFILASLTDFIDGHIARKYNMVTDFGKMIDAIADKILIDAVLVLLATIGFIHPVIAVVVIVRDIIVDSIKRYAARKGVVLGSIMMARVKTILFMVSISMILFYNLPFELIPLRISDFLLALAAILSVISAVKYYIMAKPYLKDR